MAKPVNNMAWLLLLPALLLLTFVAVVPLMVVFNYSLHDIFVLESRTWVGWEWYKELLGSSRFWESFGRSLLFTAIVLLIELPLGIAIALCIPRKGAWVAAYLVILSLPLLVPWNMIAMIWHLLLSPEFVGNLFTALSGESRWTLDALCTWVAIILMDVWHWTGLVALLCYSSLSTIPGAFYHAAAIDGASRINVLRYIELPKMKGVLMMALLLRFIDSFMVYTEPFQLNAGGPRSSTTLLAMELGKDVAAHDYGPAAARAVLYFMVILALSWTFKTGLSLGEADDPSATGNAGLRRSGMEGAPDAQ